MNKTFGILHNKGILVVASAGNDNQNSDITDHIPSALSAQYNTVVAVGALDKLNNKYTFSNYGTATVQVLAPGVNINSTSRDGQYSVFTGTSAAAPFVTSAACLLIQYCNTSAAATRDLLVEGSSNKRLNIQGSLAMCT